MLTPPTRAAVGPWPCVGVCRAWAGCDAFAGDLVAACDGVLAAAALPPAPPFVQARLHRVGACIYGFVYLHLCEAVGSSIGVKRCPALVVSVVAEKVVPPALRVDRARLLDDPRHVFGLGS